MNAIKILTCIVVSSAALTIGGEHATAAPVTIACGTAIDDYFTGRLPGASLRVVGTQLTARGGLGFSAFTMLDGYSPATTPLNTPAAAARMSFVATKGAAQYNGVFSEVFVDRGNNDVDRTEFWVSRTGAVWLRSITWNGPWTQMQSVTCYRGPINQTVITGFFDYPGWSTDFYMFVLRGEPPLI